MAPKKKQKVEQTYEVEKIVDSKGTGKNAEYFVKWEGFSASENTWEPVANLASCKQVRDALPDLPLGGVPSLSPSRPPR